MAISLGQLKFDVLTLVNKSASLKGFYTDEKMELGARDGLAMIAVEMFIGGQGWQDKARNLTVEEGMVSVDLPADICFINQVRFLFGNVYYPMMYDNQRQNAQVEPGTGVNFIPPTYRILNNAIWFNPALSQGGTLQLEYTTYIRNMENDADVFPANLDISMYQFLFYHVASFCVASVGKADPEWQRWENYWYNQMRLVITKRNNQIAYIKEFDA